MKKTFFTLLLLFNSILNQAQSENESYKYRVSLSDLEMSIYEKDSTANGIVLYEYGNSFFDKREYVLVTEEKHKIKILNKKGFDNATITIHLYNNERAKEKIKDIVATTYTLENGSVIKTNLDKNAIFEEKYDENHTLIKFTMPNVKEGSVITYSYKLQSPFMFKYKGWEFQGNLPKIYSEYNTSIPANYDYNIKLVGYKKLDKAESVLKPQCLEGYNGSYADCTNSIYIMKDIPAFIEEDYMTSKNNYLARIEYELKTFKGFDGTVKNYTKTWETVDKDLESEPNIGRQLVKQIKIDNFLDPIVINEANELNRAKAIYKYVQGEYTWNNEFSIFKDVSVKDLIKNRSGNVLSVNIFLHNILKEANIDVKPILLSTRNNGFITQIYPVITDFNYLIVKATINGQVYLLDATDKFLEFGELPYRCLNQYGRLLDFKNGSEWIDIKLDNISSLQYSVELDISNTESIKGKIDSRSTGYYALDLKKSYYPNKESYIEELQNSFINYNIIDHKVTQEEKDFEFNETYTIEHENNLDEDNIYLNPFLIKTFKENPFKLQERTYPIDFGYKKSYYYAVKLILGEAYEIIEKPKDLNLRLPNDKGFIRFSNNVFNDDYVMTLKVELTDSFYPLEYYPYLKEFMSKIVDIQNNSLVLIKKK